MKFSPKLFVFQIFYKFFKLNIKSTYFITIMQIISAKQTVNKIKLISRKNLQTLYKNIILRNADIVKPGKSRNKIGNAAALLLINLLQDKTTSAATSKVKRTSLLSINSSVVSAISSLSLSKNRKIILASRIFVFFSNGISPSLLFP